jgi:hypothetical protein
MKNSKGDTMSGSRTRWRRWMVAAATAAATALVPLIVATPAAAANQPAFGTGAFDGDQTADGLPQTKLVADDGAAGDRFGNAVAVAGDTAVVGALLATIDGKLAQGAAYVFTRSGDQWLPGQKLTASDGQLGDQFGSAVAFDGETLVIGAREVDGGAGAVYVFTRSDGQWVEQAKLTAADGQPGDRFGDYAAVDGDTIVVGSPGVDGPGSSFEQGAAYVFTRTDDGWHQQAQLLAPDGQRNDQFGHGVAVAGDTVLIGAPFARAEEDNLRGVVYAFSRTGQDWGEPTVLTASDGSALDRFGFSVDIAGDTAVIGAIGAAGAEPSTGAAYVFEQQPDGWIEQAKLVTSDSVGFDNVGAGVAISPAADRVLVGADFAAVGDAPLQGAGYLFVRDGAGWVEQDKLIAADGVANDSLGRSVALSDDAALAGSFGGPDKHGAAYLFALPDQGGDGPDGVRLTASDGTAGDLFGRAVAIDGDTALIGADWADIDGNFNQGAAYVFVRDGEAWVEQAKLTVPEGASSEQFGISVDLSGDTAVVGGAGEAAYVFTRTGTTWSRQATLTAPQVTGRDLFGISVAIDRDTIVVGAREADPNGNNNQGAAWVFTRSGQQWSVEATLTASDGAAYDLFGDSVALDGDTVVVGSEFADPAGRDSQGAAYVFTRSNGQWQEQAKLISSDGVAGDRFGTAVAVAGDTAVVGAAHVAGRQGAAYVFERTEEGWQEQARFTPEGEPEEGWFGAAVTTTGPSILVGALHEDDYRGGVYAFVRDEGGWSPHGRLAARDAADDHQFGNAVALDGGTALVGAWTATVDGNIDQGAAYVYQLEVPAPDPDPGPGPDPDPAPTMCDTTIKGLHTGPLTIEDGVTCLAAGAHVLGEVNVHAGAGLVATAAVIQGPVSAIGAAVLELAFTQVTGPLLVSATVTRVSLFANQVTGSVTLVANTTGDTVITVSGNTVVGSLSCFSNDPVPTDHGLPNTVTAGTFGQCADGPPPVVITTTELPALNVLETYRAELTAEHGTPPYTWSADQLPAGLTLDPDTGVVANDPTAPAITGPIPDSISVTVTDSRGGTDQKTLPLASVVVTRMATGLEHTCAVTTATTVYCWGKNLSGQLGDGTTENRPLPTPVVDPDDPTGMLTGAVDVSAREAHTCVTMVDGTVSCWGFNGGGRLGVGHDRPEVLLVPSRVVGPGGATYLTDVVSVSAGGLHTCALTEAGIAYCWGDNFRGQLGSSHAGGVPAPVADPQDPTQPLTGLTAIGTGGFHSCAVTQETTAYCWGWNNAGQLGIGDYVPVQSRQPQAVVGADGQPLTGLAAVDGGTCTPAP